MSPKKLFLILLQSAWSDCLYNPNRPGSEEFVPTLEYVNHNYNGPLSEESNSRLNYIFSNDHDVTPSYDPGSVHYGYLESDEYHYPDDPSNHFSQQQQSHYQKDALQPHFPSKEAHQQAHSFYNTQFHTSMHTLNHPATLLQALNNDRLKFNQEDLLQVPLPYYFAARLRYPLKKNNHRLKKGVISLINEALKHSSFNAEPQAHILPNRLFDENDFQPGKSFLSILCLRNLAFIYSIGSEQAAFEQLTETLNWLHEILSSESSISSTAKEIIRNQLDEKSQPSQWLSFQYRSQGGRLHESRSNDSEAREELVVLTILEYYYKSTNRDKWKEFFDEKNTFLKFFVRLTDLQFGHKSRTRYTKFSGSNLLPWAADEHFEVEKLSWVFSQERDELDLIRPYLPSEGDSAITSLVSQEEDFNPSSRKKRKLLNLKI